MRLLNKYSKNIASQYGEDGIIEFLIKSSLIPIKNTSFECGASDGITNSNTYNLWANLNFKSILVEAAKDRFESLNKKFSNRENLTIINAFLTSKGRNSIDDILSKCENTFHDSLGVLSIDIDSFDYYIFKYLKNNAQIIIIEFNNSIPPYIDYKDPEGEIYLRCSVKSLENLAISKGYKIVACTVTNAILLREDCFDKSIHPDLPVECLIDYNQMYKTNDMYFGLIHSQMITSKPLFTRKPNFLDRLYFNFSRLLFVILKKRSEPFKRPNARVKKELDKAKIYY
jgi:hypothetical protein